MSRRKHTVAEDRYLSRVAQLSCAVCFRLGWDGRCEEIHHILEGGRRIGHGAVLPLCREHHQGPTRLPGGTFRYKFTELDLLNDTILRLA